MTDAKLNDFDRDMGLEARIEALTEQLAAALQDADEAEAYAWELEQRLAKTVKAVEALRDMCAEFRGHDLPYGSKAYAKATATLAELEGKE